MSQSPLLNTPIIRPRSVQKQTAYYTEEDVNDINDISQNRKASSAHRVRPKRKVERTLHAQISELEAKVKALDIQLQQSYRKDFDSIHVRKKLREENRALLSQNSEKDAELAAATKSNQQLEDQLTAALAIAAKSSQQVDDQLKAELAMKEHLKDEVTRLGISNQQLKEQLKVEVALAAKSNQQLARCSSSQLAMRLCYHHEWVRTRLILSRSSAFGQSCKAGYLQPQSNGVCRFQPA
jgi:hypothetical protein